MWRQRSQGSQLARAATQIDVGGPRREVTTYGVWGLAVRRLPMVLHHSSAAETAGGDQRILGAVILDVSSIFFAFFQVWDFFGDF